MIARNTLEPPALEPVKVKKTSGLLRRFAPLFSDLFFVFITVWMFMTSPAGWKRLLLDADTTLHIRIGQQILATGTVPHEDLFAFSKVAQPWYAFEWLSETLYALAFQVASYKGVALLAGVLIALYVTLLLKYTVWKGANGLIALVLMLLAATGTSIHFHARPHLLTLVLLTASIWILEYNRRNGGKLIWVLVPITVLWANLHGGFFMFFVLLGLRVVACGAEAWLWPEERAVRRGEALQLLMVSAACVVASLANPYGFKLHEHIFETLRSTWIIENVSEFKSPTFRSEEMYDIMVLLFAGLASISSLVRKKNLVDPLWILFLAYCSLTSVRHATIFMLVATPIIAVELSEWWALSSGKVESFAARHAQRCVATTFRRFAGNRSVDSSIRFHTRIHRHQLAYGNSGRSTAGAVSGKARRSARHGPCVCIRPDRRLSDFSQLSPTTGFY